jgi:hypothetical protein
MQMGARLGATRPEPNWSRGCMTPTMVASQRSCLLKETGSSCCHWPCTFFCYSCHCSWMESIKELAPRMASTAV